MNPAEVLLWICSSPALVPAACEELALLVQESAQENTQEDAQASSRDVRGRLAEIRLSVATERDYAAAQEQLDVLFVMLAERSGQEALTLLGLVEGLRSEIRDALERAPGLGQDHVDEAVLAALQRGDFAFLRELGARAAPGLASAVREMPERLSGEADRDPLLLLFQVDPLAADRLLVQMAEHDGFFWKKRTVRAIAEDAPWGREEMWTTDEPQRWLGKGIQSTLERFVEDADVGDTALRSLALLSGRHVETEVFLAALRRALSGTSALRREVAKEAISKHYLTPLLGLYEELLESQDANLRVFAAKRLSRHGPPTALLGRAEDSSQCTTIRRLLAWALGRGKGTDLE